MKYQEISNEESLKIAVVLDYFGKFKYDTLGKIDFCISQRDYSPKGDALAYYFLWAEAKKGSSEIEKSLAQLIITVGKERSFEKVMPAIYLGCFDVEKIAFVPYSDIQDIFYQNRFQLECNAIEQRNQRVQTHYNWQNKMCSFCKTKCVVFLLHFLQHCCVFVNFCNKKRVKIFKQYADNSSHSTYTKTINQQYYAQKSSENAENQS